MLVLRPSVATDGRNATVTWSGGCSRAAVAADPDLRASSDADLVGHAVVVRRTLVTNNVVDFERLRRTRSAAGEPVPPLIYASFPRDRRFIGRLVTALDQVCTDDAVTAGGGVRWLQATTK